MNLALRTRGIVICTISAVVCGVLAGAFGQQLLAIPFLGSLFMPTAMPLPVIPALLLSVILGANISGAKRSWMSGAVRNIWAHSTGFALGILLLGTIVCALTAVLTGTGQFPTVLFIRDLAGLVSLWLLGVLFGLGSTATVVPVAYVAFSSVFARSKNAQYYPWAWIMQPHPHSWFGIASIVAGVLAAGLLIKRRKALR